MSETRSPAEERLLDAALREALGRVPHASAEPSAASRTSASHVSASSSTRWLAAALMLLGVGVVAVTMWRAGGAGSGGVVPASGQDPSPAPSPLPAEVSAEGVSALAALPVDTVNLVARLGGPADLRELARFKALRRLVVLGVGAAKPAAPGSWAAASQDAHALAVLGNLASLEVLQLHSALIVRADHLAPLRRLPRLRSLTFGNAVCGAEHAAAIVALPALRELHLQMALVEPGFLRALAARSLTALVLDACPGLDDAAWGAVRQLRSLQRLTVTAQNGGGCSVAGTPQRLGTLGDAAFTTFAALPDLRALGLDECEFDDAFLAELPAQLQELDVGDRPMQSARSLRRLGNLRALTFGCGLPSEAAKDLLGALALQRLDYRGRRLDAALLQAIAGQPQLTELALHLRSPVDLTPLTQATHLAVLELRGGAGLTVDPYKPSIEQLTPLRDCRGLKRLRLSNCGLESGAVGELLRRRVTIECVEYL